jgi:hypothetical protein
MFFWKKNEVNSVVECVECNRIRCCLTNKAYKFICLNK